MPTKIDGFAVSVSALDQTCYYLYTNTACRKLTALWMKVSGDIVS